VAHLTLAVNLPGQSLADLLRLPRAMPAGLPLAHHLPLRSTQLIVDKEPPIVSISSDSPLSVKSRLRHQGSAGRLPILPRYSSLEVRRLALYHIRLNFIPRFFQQILDCPPDPPCHHTRPTVAICRFFYINKQLDRLSGSWHIVGRAQQTLDRRLAGYLGANNAANPLA